MTGQQPVVAVETVHAARLQPPMQSVLQKMCAPLVEVHAAFLVDKRLQQLQFGFRQYDRNRRCGHSRYTILKPGSTSLKVVLPVTTLRRVRQYDGVRLAAISSKD